MTDRIEALILSSEAAPTPEEVAVFTRCVSIARRRLRLPARIIGRWRVRDPESMSRGACDGDELVVYVGLEPHQDLETLARTVFHELQHLSDYHTQRPFSRRDFEDRADAFAASMVSEWREDEDETQERATRPLEPVLTRPPSHARYLAGEIQRRLVSLRRRVDGEASLAISALLRIAGELDGEISRRKG